MGILGRVIACLLLYVVTFCGCSVGEAPHMAPLPSQTQTPGDSVSAISPSQKDAEEENGSSADFLSSGSGNADIALPVAQSLPFARAETALEGESHRQISAFAPQLEEGALIGYWAIPSHEAPLAAAVWREGTEWRSVLYSPGENRILGEAPSYLLPPFLQRDFPRVDHGAATVTAGAYTAPLVGFGKQKTLIAVSPAGGLVLYGGNGENIMVLDVVGQRVVAQLPVSAISGIAAGTVSTAHFLTEDLVVFVTEGEDDIWETSVYHLSYKRRFLTCEGVYRIVPAGKDRWAFLPEKEDISPMLLDLSLPENKKVLQNAEMPYADVLETPSFSLLDMPYGGNGEENAVLLFDQTGQWAASFLADKLRLYNMASGELRRTLTLSPDLLTPEAWQDAVLAPKGAFLLFSSKEGTPLCLHLT